MSLTLQDVDFGEQSIIYITDHPNSVEWSRPATEELIRLFSDNLELFERGILKTKRQIYERISPELAKKGFFFSVAQCENKWKSLKRAYLSKFEKSPCRSQRRTRLFEKEVEKILKRERPSLKKEIEELSTVNLNQPPGFTKEEVSSDNDYEEIDHDHDADLVQKVLQGSQSPMDTNFTENSNLENNIESVLAANENFEHSYSFLKDSTSKSPRNIADSSNDMLIKELSGLKDVIKKNCEINTQILKQNSQTNESILNYFDIFEKMQEENLELEKRRFDKEAEMVQQMKIQNSLIAKLIQKLGNRSMENM